MQETSSLYKQIFTNAQDRLEIEYKVTVNNADVTLINGSITEVLYNTLSLGNLIAKTLDMSFVKRDNVAIPKGAEIQVEYRISDGRNTSEWIPKGTFFIDTRKTNRGVTTLTCYDSMLKANTPYMKSGEWTGRTTLRLYQDICTLIGVEQDDDTVTILTTTPYTISEAPSIGENGTSMVQILEWIGTMYGYNWTITEDNTLKMISVIPDTYIEFKASEDIDFSDNTATIDRIQIFTTQDGSDYIRYPQVSVPVWDSMTGYVLEGTSLYATREIVDGLASRFIGKSYRGFDATAVAEDPAVQIGDGVEIEDVPLILVKRVTDFVDGFVSMSAPYEEEVVSEYPMTESLVGLVRNVKANGASFTVLDNKIEAEVVNRRNADVKAVKVQYYLSDSDFVPAHGSWQDVIPAVTEGMYLWSRMYITYNDDTFSTTDPVLAEDATYQEILSQSARIKVNADNISGEIEQRSIETSNIKTNYSVMQQTVDGVIITLGEKITEADAQALVDEYGSTVEQYLRFAQGILELGESNSQFKALLSNTKLAFTGANGSEVAWISNNQLFITDAVINGTITMDPFVQRISSRHFQIVYTGA